MTPHAGIHEPSRPYRLVLLNGFGLVHRDVPVTVPFGVQRLLAFLALHPFPLRRSHVASSLWPDSPEPRAATSLRSALWRVRALELDVVVATNQRLALDPQVEVDAHQLTATVRRLRGGRERWRPCDLDPRAMAGELLPDWVVDEWTAVERERLRQLALHGLELMSARLLGLGRHGEAVEAALAAVQLEPLRESAHRALVMAHLAEGNPVEALRQYEWYARLLATEMGLTPSGAMTALVHGIRGVDRRRWPPHPTPAQRLLPGR